MTDEKDGDGKRLANERGSPRFVGMADLACSADGIALNSPPHPGSEPYGPAKADTTGIADREFTSGSVEIVEVESCIPPENTPVISLHWVERVGTASGDVSAFHCRPVVWEWHGEGRWYHDGVGDFAVCAYRAGYRYLGPLEYVAMTDQPTDIDYHGPVRDGKAIPNPPHEQFHRAVGDVIAGKIIPEARRQMQEALKRAPKDAPTTASTSRPMPEGAVRFIPMEKGVRLHGNAT